MSRTFFFLLALALVGWLGFHFGVFLRPDVEFLNYDSAVWERLCLHVLWTTVAVALLREVLRGLFRLRRRYIHLAVSESSSLAVRRSASLLGAAAIWYSFVPIGELPYPRRIDQAIHFVFLVSAVWLVAGLWDCFCDSLVDQSDRFDKRAERLLIPVTRKLVRASIWVGGILILLSTYDVDWKGIIAGLGIGGLIVALAAKDSVENIFGSFTILFDMPFALGDWVKVNGIDGVVEEINLRSTRIRTFEDSVITLPNSNLIKAAVENMGARRVRRQKFLVRLSYKSKADAVERLSEALMKYLDAHKQVAKGRSTVQMNDLGEASFGVLVQCYFEVDNYEAEMKLRGEVMRKILRLVDESGGTFVEVAKPAGQA